MATQKDAFLAGEGDAWFERNRLSPGSDPPVRDKAGTDSSAQPVSYATEQEVFWAGEFGDHYTERNRGESLLSANVMLFARLLARTGPLESAIELGANIGLNLQALRQLLPSIQLAAVEINSAAVAELYKITEVEIFHTSILEFVPSRQYDLAFTKGVLIHIAPERLIDAYDKLYQSSRRYLLVAEYYNPTPVELNYRGHNGRLFKRDFAGEILDRYPDLRLIDYGFIYHRDSFPQDDLTWFLMEKGGLKC